MRTAIITIIIMLLAGCKFSYRYPCQDPANWDQAWCSNDVCKADGTCTEKLLGFQPAPNQKISPEDMANTEGQGHENVTETKPVISTEKPADCKTTVVYRDRIVESKIQHVTEPREEKVIEERPAREMPLSMNSIVDTVGHNTAAKIN